MSAKPQPLRKRDCEQMKERAALRVRCVGMPSVEGLFSGPEQVARKCSRQVLESDDDHGEFGVNCEAL
jgi:hypothetical protein